MHHFSQGINTKQAHKAIPDGHFEEEQGHLGFFGPVSHLIRKQPSTRWTNIDGPLKPRLYDLVEYKSTDQWQRLLFNDSVSIGYQHVTVKSADQLVGERNADGDIVYFCHQGSGQILSEYGQLDYRRGHYVIIPKCVTYTVNATEPTTFLTIENRTSHYVEPDRGIVGRHAVFDVNAIGKPNLEVQESTLSSAGIDIKQIRVKHCDELTTYSFSSNVYDVVGWKGDLFPYTLHMDDMMPLMSHRAHLPPSAHSTFVARDFVICTFLPRPLEHDEDALKVPFYHQNIDYDEVLFYHDGDFFSRDNLHAGMMTFHPAGFPHGPHPKAIEAVKTKTETKEYAVMIDTRWPLKQDNFFGFRGSEGLLEVLANKVDIPWGHDLTPDQAMTLAIKLAQMGKGHVEPNPPVGCVILNREGHLIGAGYHRKYGGDHAEVAALKSAASSNLDGAVIYVTLEPCAHHGKTPSCAKHIANLPVQKVIYGLQDPNPLVAGQGAKILSDAGVIAELWVGETDSLYDLVEMFFHNMIHKRAFVTLKVATSLDGFMGLQSGESQWITDEVARKYSHYLRAQHGGVAVGLGTYRHDNPSLDVRHEDYPDKKNTAVILDPLGESFKTLPHSKLASCHDEKDRWVVTGESAPQVAGPWQQITAPMSSHGEFDLIDLTKVLYDNGVHSVYVEGGAATYGSFLRQQAWNRLQLFMAPKIIGGNAGLGWTAETGADRLDDAWILEKSSIMDLGGDWLISGLSRQTLNDRKPI